MNIIKQCRMNCSPHPTFKEQQSCSDCENHDEDLVYASFDKATHCITSIAEKKALESRIASLENNLYICSSAHSKVSIEKEALEKELDITNKILHEQTEVLRQIPECELHGLCLPHIKQWIANAKAKLESLTVK